MERERGRGRKGCVCIQCSAALKMYRGAFHGPEAMRGMRDGTVNAGGGGGEGSVKGEKRG